LEAISESYDTFEKDRKLLEHSIELSSAEMVNLNDTLRREAEEVSRAHLEITRILNNIDEAFFSVNAITYQYFFISPSCEKIYG
ncbi:hypothetical protein ACSTJG_24520, partial [Vibrio parahaemolyticus]